MFRVAERMLSGFATLDQYHAIHVRTPLDRQRSPKPGSSRDQKVLSALSGGHARLRAARAVNAIVGMVPSPGEHQGSRGAATGRNRMKPRGSPTL